MTPNLEGTMERKNEVFSSVGADNMDKNKHQVCYLVDVEFHWESDELDVDANFRPGIDKHFSPSIFSDFEMFIDYFRRNAVE